MGSLLGFEAARARDYYRRAAALLPRADRRRLVAARIMGAIYFDLLRRIEHSGYAVFGPVIRASRWRKGLIAASVWTQSMLGLPVERTMARADPR